MGMTCEVFIVPAQTAQELVADPSGVHDVITHLEGSENALSLEKSWHGLHYVLTGTAWEGKPPLNFIAGGGEPLSDNADPFESARMFPPTDVQAMHAALGAFSDEDFERNFDLHGLTTADIYPQIWDEPLEDLRQEYQFYFQALRKHVQRAAESGQALLIAIV